MTPDRIVRNFSDGLEKIGATTCGGVDHFFDSRECVEQAQNRILTLGVILGYHTDTPLFDYHTQAPPTCVTSSFLRQIAPNYSLSRCSSSSVWKKLNA